MNTWIDVDKKLPKFNERVLVFIDDGIHNEIEIGELRKHEKDGHIFWHFWFEDLNLLYTAAWRPLPKISKRLHNLKWEKLIKRKRKKRKGKINNMGVLTSTYCRNCGTKLVDLD